MKSLDCRQDGMALGDGPRASWLFNSTIAGIEEADVILLVGTNPRLEAPVFNARLRKRLLTGGLRVGVIGEQADLTFPYDYLGAGPQTLAGLAKAKNDFVTAFKNAKAPAVIVGAGALARADGAATVAGCRPVPARTRNADLRGALQDCMGRTVSDPVCGGVRGDVPRRGVRHHRSAAPRPGRTPRYLAGRAPAPKQGRRRIVHQQDGRPVPPPFRGIGVTTMKRAATWLPFFMPV